jgi:SAM-dependent methyltransferase
MTSPAPRLFDRNAAALARARARVLDGERFLEDMAMEGLVDRLAAVARSFGHGLWIGEAVPDGLRPLAAEWSCSDFDDAETLNAPQNGFDLAISLLSLQTINDLPGALVQIRRALKPDGLFLGAVLGGASLTELRRSFAIAESETLGGISPRVSPFGDARDMGGLLQRGGFALPVADVERTLVRYTQLTDLARDLRAHGLTNVLAQRRKLFLPRRTWTALEAQYAAHHASDGKLNATFEIVYLTGWAPHESQQQPLKPGSAKTRLADALGVTEYSTKDTAGS